jgi:excisionase family DNA binding protein
MLKRAKNIKPNATSTPKPSVRADLPMDLCLFAIPEAGAVLRLSRSKVYNLISANQLRTVVIGRRRLVPGRMLREFIDSLAPKSA